MSSLNTCPSWCTEHEDEAPDPEYPIWHVVTLTPPDCLVEAKLVQRVGGTLMAGRVMGLRSGEAEDPHIDIEADATYPATAAELVEVATGVLTAVARMAVIERNERVDLQAVTANRARVGALVAEIVEQAVTLAGVR